MDDLNKSTTQNYTGGNPYESVVQPTVAQPASTQPVSTGEVVYAGFFQRFAAALIDGVLVSIASFVLGFFLGLFLGAADWVKSVGGLAGMIMSASYYVYFISQRGQTLGKQALGIRVQNESTGQNLDVVSAILREIVGKFLSGLVLLLGYFWMLWDPKKQTWHDKIAKSVVVKVK